MRPGDPPPDVEAITRTAYQVAIGMCDQRAALIEANDSLLDASDRARRGDGASFLIG